MALIHDFQVRDSIKTRVRGLSLESRRAWGKMSVDQMLHHLNLALESALGRVAVRARPMPLPGFVIKFLLLNAPWPRSAPTAPEFVAGDRYDFEMERARCLALLDEFSGKPIEGAWPAHHVLGGMTGRDYSRLNAKHFEHHLRQFGA